MFTLEYFALTVLDCLTGDFILIMHTTILLFQPFNTIIMDSSGLLTLDLASCKNFGHFSSEYIVTDLIFKMKCF